MENDNVATWTVKDYSERYTRLAVRFREQAEELTRTRAALVQAEKELVKIRTERRRR